MPNIAHYSHNTEETEKLCGNDNKPVKLDDNKSRSKRSPRKSVTIMPTIVTKKVTPPSTRLGDRKQLMKPLYHLKGKEIWKYIDVEPLDPDEVEILTKDPNILFKRSLEVLNRRGVRPLFRPHHDEEITDICRYFFDNIGHARVSVKMCTQCRDISKDRTGKDWYFMDLMEISQQRTILCLECMGEVVKQEVVGTPQDIAQELLDLREKQPHGVYVDPFLITCGY